MFIDMTKPEFDWRAGYKMLISAVTPRPIALVSTVNNRGQTNLAPFSFFNMVSANPPVAMFCPSINRNGEHKDTYRNAAETREFVIAIVSESIARPMLRTAVDLPYGESEFDYSGLTPAPARIVRAPLVKESPVNMECRLRQIVSMGDHPGAGQIVLGDIVALHVNDELLGTTRDSIDPLKLRAVGRLGGESYSVVDRVLDLEIPKK